MHGQYRNIYQCNAVRIVRLTLAYVRAVIMRAVHVRAYELVRTARTAMALT
jgi:hypothetical protein